MNLPRLDRRINFAAMILVVLMLPSCAAATRGVGVKSLAADLVFGIPPLEEDVAPPDTFPTGDLEVADVGGAPRGGFGPTAIRPGFATRSCEEPETNEVENPALDKPTGGLPKVGKYVWVQKGSLSYGPEVGHLPIAGFSDRKVTSAKTLPSTPAGDFTYTTEQQEGNGTVVRQTFEVIVSRPDTQRQTVQVLREQGQLNGVFLTQIVKIFPQGAPLEFNPEPPLLYLPFPVTSGYTLTSESVDPGNLQTVTHTIDVRNRQRYNACGTLVDGWFVNASQTFQGRDNTTRNYDYTVGTSVGSLIIFEHVETPCAVEPNDQPNEPNSQPCAAKGDLIYDTNIGQLEPGEF